MLENKVAVVTGVSRGLGASITRRLCRAGARVEGIFHRSVEKARQLEEELQAAGFPVRFHQGSVTDPTFVRDLFQDVWQQAGSVDMLVNNAGVVQDGFMAHMSLRQWDDVFATSFTGTHHCIFAALPYMLRGEGGTIVNVISPSGLLGREGQVNYSTAKGAVAGLTRLVARRYGSRGIRCNAISPGLVDTDLIGQMSEKDRDTVLQRTDLQRLGTPEEIAEAVLFLAGDASRYCSGTILRADGGLFT